MPKTTQPKMSSNIFSVLAINFIFSDNLPTIKTLQFQPSQHPNNTTFTFTKFSRHQNFTFSNTSPKVQLTLLLPSHPILPLLYTISTAHVYPTITPRLPLKSSLRSTFPFFYFNDLDSLNFSNF